MIEFFVIEGVILLLDGWGFCLDKYFDGNWVGFIIIDNVIFLMVCYKEEIFGLVLVCLLVSLFDEGIDMMNKNEYGNGIVVFIFLGVVVERFRRRIEVG